MKLGSLIYCDGILNENILNKIIIKSDEKEILSVKVTSIFG